jgi:hypothetical protein
VAAEAEESQAGLLANIAQTEAALRIARPLRNQKAW